MNRIYLSSYIIMKNETVQDFANFTLQKNAEVSDVEKLIVQNYTDMLTDEQLIMEHKLTIIDNIDEVIITEYNEELKNLEKELSEIKTIMESMNDAVNIQGEELDIAEINVEDADIYIDDGVEEIVAAAHYQAMIQSRIVKTVSGASLGALVGGGVGAVFGIVPALVAGGVGTFTGMITGLSLAYIS